MVEQPVLETQNICKSFGAVIASDTVYLSIPQGELHAIIGPNGAGKSTLIAQICGQLDPDMGKVLLNGKDITRVPQQLRPHLGLVRSFQITSIFPDYSALDNVAMAVQLKLGHSFRFFADARTDPSLCEPALHYLQQVGLEEQANRQAFALSHGQQRRLELAMALALQPRVLVLDEPMAGMGAEESADIVALLKSLKGSVTMLLVEHDMDAVFALADRISVLVYGKIIACGVPAEIRENAVVREAYLGSEDSDDA